MSIISEALQDQQAARFISALDCDEPSHVERSFRDPARHPRYSPEAEALRDYGFSMFDRSSLAMAADRFRRSMRGHEEGTRP